MNVVFLTLITSFTATFLMNAIPRTRNPQSVLRLTALHLANEQFAIMESKGAGNFELKSYVDEEDLTTKNYSENVPIKFDISVKSLGGNAYEVEVSWNEREDSVKLERTIRSAD